MPCPPCPPHLLSFSPSMQRSRYRILGQIGQGQFGRVFCAIYRQTGEIVALKDLDKDKFPTRLFLRELSNLTALEHPNIVACQGLEYTKSGRYLVMEYCEGGTLRDLMESEGKLSFFYSLKLISDILLALEHAHSRDIIHCDLKPENILLTISQEGWTARISDFGIARIRLEAGGKEIGRGYTGSPAYMAPERFYGQYSPASDLYGVGVMLYELVVGKRPFSGLPGEIMAAHMNQQIEIPRTVPFLLRSCLTTALQKLPQKRFRSASEMLKSVQLAMDVLVTEKSSTDFLSVTPLVPSANDLQIIHKEPLAEPVTSLAVDSQQVYLGMGDRLHGRIYGNSQLAGNPVELWKVKFDAPITQISLRPQGCYVTTQSQENCALYCLSKSATDLMYCLSGSSSGSETSTPVPLLTLPSKRSIAAIESQGSWLAIARDIPSEADTLQIFKLSELQSIRSSVIPSLPSQLVVLDRDRGLAIFSPLDNSNNSVFRLFNRRGGLIEAFSLPLTLRLVTASKSNSYCLFAIEKSNPVMGILIHLKPLKITRIALEILPEFILAREWGYILGDRTGQFRLLDNEGNRIGRFEVPLPPTAITAFGKFKLLVATWLERKGMLFAIDFQKMVTFKSEED